MLYSDVYTMTLNIIWLLFIIRLPYYPLLQLSSAPTPLPSTDAWNEVKEKFIFMFDFATEKTFKIGLLVCWGRWSVPFYAISLFVFLGEHNIDAGTELFNELLVVSVKEHDTLFMLETFKLLVQIPNQFIHVLFFIGQN